MTSGLLQFYLGTSVYIKNHTKEPSGEANLKQYLFSACYVNSASEFEPRGSVGHEHFCMAGYFLQGAGSPVTCHIPRHPECPRIMKKGNLAFFGMIRKHSRHPFRSNLATLPNMGKIAHNILSPAPYPSCRAFKSL
jgi:hypothetical protein